MLITVQRAAEILGVHADTVRDWTNKGIIPAVRTPGGHRRIEISSLKNLYSKSPNTGGVNEGEDTGPNRNRLVG